MARKFEDGDAVVLAESAPAYLKDEMSNSGSQYGVVEDYKAYDYYSNPGYKVMMKDTEGGDIRALSARVQASGLCAASPEAQSVSMADVLRDEIAVLQGQIYAKVCELHLRDRHPGVAFTKPFFVAYGNLQGVVNHEQLIQAAAAVSGVEL